MKIRHEKEMKGEKNDNIKITQTIIADNMIIVNGNLFMLEWFLYFLKMCGGKAHSALIANTNRERERQSATHASHSDKNIYK